MHNFSFSERFFKEMEAPAYVKALKNERKFSYHCKYFISLRTKEEESFFTESYHDGIFPRLISSRENSRKRFSFLLVFPHVKGYRSLFWESL